MKSFKYKLGEIKFIFLILDGLAGSNIFFHFLGGYDRFSTQYPDYCLKTKTLAVSSPPSSVESSCTSCGTPQHDQVTTLAAVDTLRSANGQHCVTLNVLLTAVIRCSFRLI